MTIEKLADFIHDTTVMFVGARNSKLNPRVNFAFGTIVYSDKKTIPFYISKVTSKKIMNH